MNKKLDRKKQKQVHRYVRATIQLIFFLLVPSAFTAAFSGVKYLFTQIGKGDAIGMTSFVTALCVLCLYTILFGRFFCGFACAFGSFGDALHGIYLWICKKTAEKAFLHTHADHQNGQQYNPDGISAKFEVSGTDHGKNFPRTGALCFCINACIT